MISLSLFLIFSLFFQDVAVITFQALSHVFKSYLPDVQHTEQKDGTSDANSIPSLEHPRKSLYKPILEGDPIVEYPILLASLLDGLAIMTEKFKLKWQECVETICILSIAQEILNHTAILPMVKDWSLKLNK